MADALYDPSASLSDADNWLAPWCRRIAAVRRCIAAFDAGCLPRAVSRTSAVSTITGHWPEFLNDYVQPDSTKSALGIGTSPENRPARRVILTGIAGNICVLFTANDAHMRDLRVFAPANCIVSNTVADNDHALRQIETVMKGHAAPSTDFRFLGRGRTRTDQRP